NDFVLETSVTGTILNGLSHLKNSKNISQFAINLSRGLGSNLRKQSREALIREIFSWANIIIPDLNSPCDTYYNERTQRLEVYQMQRDEISASEYENSSLDVIQTEDCMRTIDYLSPWLLNEKMPPFLLVGPDGCGKSTLLRNCLQQEQTISSTMVHCNAQTKPHHVLQKLMSVCTIIGAQSGRVLRPKESDHLILYLRDLSLPKPDKWGTSQLLAWLQQILTYNGFYDENAEWISLEGIQIVGSVSSISLAGRHSLTTRFTSRMYIYAVDYPSQEQLRIIYSHILAPVIKSSLKDHAVWGSSSKVRQLIGSMTQLLEALRSEFSSDVYGNCRFTPVDLTRWSFSLFRYDLVQEGFTTPKAPDGLLRPWSYEACRIFRDRLINIDATVKFNNIISSILRKDWGVPDISALDGIYYVAGNHTSEKAKLLGKSLERLSSEDWLSIVQRNIKLYNSEVRELDVVIFQEVLDNLAKVDRVLSQHNGSLLLVGMNGSGRRLSVSVVAHAHQIPIISPKIHPNYGIKQFSNDLKMLVDSLLSSGDVPGLYTPQELEPLLNPLKDLASQEGFRGSASAFFAKRIQKNLHISLIMDYTDPKFLYRCKSNPALYKACNVLWFDEWNEQSMCEVPRLLLSGNDNNGLDVVGKEFYKYFLLIHNQNSLKNQAPRKFVAFIQNYRKIFSLKSSEIQTRKKHLL
ncbi:cytoplasmic dynein 2 heavy chain 1, partial [Trichonephila clavata]